MGRSCAWGSAVARNGGWIDSVGPCSDEVANDGDTPLTDRDGNWTYGFAVVVDDLRQGVDLVIRGRDLLSETAAQIRLGAMLGRETPAVFAHHPLIRQPDGKAFEGGRGHVRA